MQIYFPKVSGGTKEPDYKNLVQITNGQSFTKEESNFHPVFYIKVPGSSEDFSDVPSVIVLYDETAHYLHLLAYGDLNEGSFVEELVPYRGPTPPPGSGPHKYNFILYSSPNPMILSGPKMRSTSAPGGEKRAHFNLEQFVTDNELIPITSLFFTVENL